MSDAILGPYKESWMRHFEAKEDMRQCIQENECTVCRAKRKERKRVLHDEEPVPEDLRSPVFAAAPAIYSFNVPRYFTTQLRAREYGKSQDAASVEFALI